MKQYHKNPRQITKKEYADLQATLRELGDLSGIVHDLNSDEIIGGNQRSLIFDINKRDIEIVKTFDEPDEQGTVALGFVLWEGKKYNYREVRWNERQCEKANIVANKAGGSWDFDILANEWDVPDLIEWGFAPEELGITLDEPKGEDPGAQIDKAEELREKWGVVTGQLWRLGEHRLICGDCTDRAVVERVMGGEKAGMIFTDPPYNINMKPASVARRLPDITNDNMSDSDFELFLLSFLRIAKEVVGGEVYVCCDWRKYHIFFACLEQIGWDVNCLIVWNKDVRAQNLNKWAFVHEFICYHGYMGTPTLDTNVWTIKREYSDVHLTPKPIELVEKAIHSNNENLVYDPFLGSGTTLIACERLSRKCRAVEISPAYCAVAIQRWVDMTGGVPELVL